MNSVNTLWEKIKACPTKELGISCSFFGYIYDDEVVEIKYNYDFEELMKNLIELEKQGKIKLVDTNNMGYFVNVLI